MSEDDTQANSAAAAQNEGEGTDLENNNDTDTGADDQGTGNEGEGSAPDYKKQFEDQQKRANNAERFLKENGIDPKTGKPKEQARAPKKEGNGLSEQDNTRITKAEERAERAEIRSLGFTHSEDIEYLRNQARKNFDGDVFAAASDEFVKNKLERMQAARKTKEATPPPSNRGGSQSRSTKYPDFSKMSNADFDKWEKENNRR